MTCLSWNCHVLGNPRTIQIMRDLILSKRPNFVFQMKTLINKSKVETIRDMLRYVIDINGHSGGLVMF